MKWKLCLFKGFMEIGGFLTLGVPFWSPHKKDHGILGVYIGGRLSGETSFSKQRFWLSGFQVKSALARHASEGLGLIG